jgi:hypothetical protein
MRKASVTVAACATLLWAGTVRATQTPQQKCDYARITAWKTYISCVDGVVAKDAKGVTFDEFKAFWGCRHAYFKKWTAFQGKASLATSTCAAGLSNRFTVTDSGATVTDGLSGLVWELKTNSGVHDGSNLYTWSTGSNTEDGTAFTDFLTTGLNTPGFAGANGWRLPTVDELQTILADFPCTGTGVGATCTCTSIPWCIAFNDPNTQSTYWSATSYVPNPNGAWNVFFYNGSVNFGNDSKTLGSYVRAVRGGL